MEMEQDKMKKIVALNQYYYPENITTANLLVEMMSEISLDKEYEIDILCGYPNEYSQERVLLTEEFNGHKINRILYNASSRKSFLGRINNYFSFTFGVWKNRKILKEADLVITFSNPPLNPIVPSLLKRKYGYKFIYVVHDLYPDIATQAKVIRKNGVIDFIFKRLNKYVFKKCDSIVVLSKDMKSYFIEKYGHEKKVDIIPNWYKNPEKQPEVSSHSKLNVIYGGNAGIVQDMDTIIQSFKQTDTNSQHTLFMAIHGKKTDEIKEYVEKQSIKNIQFLGYLPKQEYNHFLNQIDVAIVSLINEIYGTASPSKVYSYLALGIPIIFVGNRNLEIAQIIERENIGFSIENNDVDQFVLALEKLSDPALRNIMSENARNLFIKNYELKICVKQYKSLFDKVFGE